MVERRPTKGVIQRTILEEFEANKGIGSRKSRVKIQHDHHYTSGQMSFAIRKLMEMGAFGGYPQEEVVQWRSERNPVSPEARRNISAAKKGKTRTLEERFEQSKKRKGIFYYSYVFLSREASVEEVVHITHFERPTIEKAVDTYRGLGLLGGRPTVEDTHRTRSRGHAGKPHRSHGREYPGQKENEFVLLKRLAEAGLITPDLTYKNKLDDIYRKAGSPLPEDIVERVMLELKLRGEDDPEFHVRFIEIRQAVDRAHTVSTQQLVNERDSFLAQVFSDKPRLMPTTELGKQFIAELIEARDIWSKGDRTEWILVIRYYDEHHPEVFEENADQTAFVRDRKSVAKGTTVFEQHMATSGEDTLL